MSATINYKVQFGKKIHKLPSGLVSFDELLYSIRTLFNEKLPESYTFRYEDTEGNWHPLESKDDFAGVMLYLASRNLNNLKIKIIKPLKPCLELYVLHEMPESMTQSRIGALQNHFDLNASIIKNPAANSEITDSIIQVPSAPVPEVPVRRSSPEINKQNNQHAESNNDNQNNDQSSKELSAKINEIIKNSENEIYKQKQQANEVVLPAAAQEKEVIEQQKPLSELIEIDQSNANSESSLPVVQAPQEKPKKIIEPEGFNQNQLENLRGFIEEIVEDKLREILKNYNLVPRQPSEIHLPRNAIPANLPIQPVVVQQNPLESKLIRDDDAKAACVSDSQLMNSSIMDVDKKKLRGLLITDPPAELNVSAGNPYVWSFKIQNSGPTVWPVNTRFKCLAGPHLNKSHFIGIVQPNQIISIVLPMEAPEKQDKYPEVWSLVVENSADQPAISFGPKVRYTLIVNQQSASEKNPFPFNSSSKISNSINNPSNIVIAGNKGKQPSISINESAESQTNNKYVSVATQMQQILGGEIKKYLEYLRITSPEKVPTIEEAVNNYIENMKF